MNLFNYNLSLFPKLNNTRNIASVGAKLGRNSVTLKQP